jgi:hypothetical protein
MDNEMNDVSKAKADLKAAKAAHPPLDLWQQALQAGREAHVAEGPQREAPAKENAQERQPQ